MNIKGLKFLFILKSNLIDILRNINHKYKKD